MQISGTRKHFVHEASITDACQRNHGKKACWIHHNHTKYNLTKDSPPVASSKSNNHIQDSMGEYMGNIMPNIMRSLSLHLPAVEVASSHKTMQISETRMKYIICHLSLACNYRKLRPNEKKNCQSDKKQMRICNLNLHLPPVEAGKKGRQLMSVTEKLNLRKLEHALTDS